MSDYSVRRIEYEDELWTLRVPHPLLSDLLEAKDCLIVIRHGEPPYRAVLGVPHHTEIKEDRICENRHDERGIPDPRESDKNAASYALVAFTTLRDRGAPCKLVLMAHSTTHDPNKLLDSPYTQEVFADETTLLVECHGAGPHRASALELSAGTNRLADPLRFGRLLDATLGRRFTWAAQRVAGATDALVFHADGGETPGQLELSALNTATLTEAGRLGIPAFHLEAKPAFCKPLDETNTITPDGLLLGRALARAILQYE